MEQSIRIVPKDLLCLIPKFEGEENILNLFIKKAQYIYNGYATPNNSVQQQYVFHAITSRLYGRAAALLSEREDINSWVALRDVLIQHFGDPRSEDCIAIELEQMKINTGESYIDFCHRIQHMRSTLFAKVNLITDEGVKAAKMIVYNNMALNVFLYNLTEDLIRIVRLKGCPSLEVALSIVTEEVNFMTQFNAKQKQRQASAPIKPQLSLPSTTTPGNNNRFGLIPQNKFTTPNQNFKFGIPQQQPQGFRFGLQPQNSNTGFRPAFQGNYQPTGFRFNQNPGHQNFKFGIPHQGQGFRPQLNQNFARPTLSQRPFGQPPQGFKFGIPHQNLQHPRPLENTDVSMRTARPLKQNMINASADTENAFYNNELVEDGQENSDGYNTAYYDETQAYNLEMEPQMYETTPDGHDYTEQGKIENFHAEASDRHHR